MFLEEGYLCRTCGGSWPNFRKSIQITKKDDIIDIPMAPKYYIIGGDNTQKLLVSGDNTQKLLINPVSAQCNIC